MAKNKDKKKDKPGKKRISKLDFEKELTRLQTELCHLQAWVKEKGLRVVVIFEGRDAAGKGGVIKRISERVSPRVFRIVALPAPRTARNRRCSCRDTFRTCRPPARSSCSTAAGTTGRGSSV